MGCYRLEQVVCVLQLTCVNCTRWTRALVLCATACTVTCPTCGNTCASSTTLRVSHALYVTSRSRPSCTWSGIWSASTSWASRIVIAKRRSTSSSSGARTRRRHLLSIASSRTSARRLRRRPLWPRRRHLHRRRSLASTRTLAPRAPPNRSCARFRTPTTARTL